MREVAGRFATAVDAAARARLHRAGRHRGRAWRCSAGAASSTRSTTRTATVPSRASHRVMPIVTEHGAAVVALTHRRGGPGPHRRVEGRASPSGSSTTSPTTGACASSDIIVDCLTFPIATGQEETRRDGLETIEAIREVKRRYPEVQTTLGLSNVSFGLNPAARVVLNSVFLHECAQGRPRLGDRARVQDPADDADPRRAARGRPRPGLRPAAGDDDEPATTRCTGSSTCSRASTRRAARQIARRGARRAAAGRAARSGGSSTASATGSRPTSTRRSTTAARRSTSSTTRCSPA